MKRNKELKFQTCGINGKTHVDTRKQKSLTNLEELYPRKLNSQTFFLDISSYLLASQKFCYARVCTNTTASNCDCFQ